MAKKPMTIKLDETNENWLREMRKKDKDKKPAKKKATTEHVAGAGRDNARFLEQSRLRDQIIANIAKNYGITTKNAMAELVDPDAEAVYEYINDPNLRREVYSNFRAMGFRTASVDSKTASLIREAYLLDDGDPRKAELLARIHTRD